jgi:hypothetical protein
MTSIVSETSSRREVPDEWVPHTPMGIPESGFFGACVRSREGGRLLDMHSRLSQLEPQARSSDVLGADGRTRPRVQVVSLSVCAGAAGAVLASLHLPWFGSLGDPTVVQFSAVSGDLWRTGLVPASQSWGYLIAAWSALLVVLALLAAIACALPRPRNQWPMSGVLLCIAVASVMLIALVLAEVTSHAQFDLVSSAPADWGAWLSLGLAVVSSAGAWLAWASSRFPHLWGLEASADRLSQNAGRGAGDGSWGDAANSS